MVKIRTRFRFYVEVKGWAIFRFELGLSLGPSLGFG